MNSFSDISLRNLNPKFLIPARYLRTRISFCISSSFASEEQVAKYETVICINISAITSDKYFDFSTLSLFSSRLVNESITGVLGYFANRLLHIF
jgi:hypothetical protein